MGGGLATLTVTYDEEERDTAHRTRLQWSNYDPLDVPTFVTNARKEGSNGVEAVLIMVAKRITFRARQRLIHDCR